jgi:hypothetical protein
VELEGRLTLYTLFPVVFGAAHKVAATLALIEWKFALAPALLIVVAPSLGWLALALKQEESILALDAGRHSVYDVILGTVGVFLQTLALAQQIVVFTLGTALGAHLQAVRDDALVVAELEGR